MKTTSWVDPPYREEVRCGSPTGLSAPDPCAIMELAGEVTGPWLRSCGRLVRRRGGWIVRLRDRPIRCGPGRWLAGNGRGLLGLRKVRLLGVAYIVDRHRGEHFRCGLHLIAHDPVMIRRSGRTVKVLDPLHCSNRSVQAPSPIATDHPHLQQGSIHGMHRMRSVPPSRCRRYRQRTVVNLAIDRHPSGARTLRSLKARFISSVHT